MNYRDIPGYDKAVLPYHALQALAAGARYRLPGRKMRVIGVTGTNGKTTTCFMIWKMLAEAGHKTGLMTTVAWGDSENGLTQQIEHMTTADSFTLNRRMRRIYEAGAEFLVLEVTSHALTQFRTLGIPIEVAVMTNVTHEHLDYHKTFLRYVKAKTKLFSGAKYGVVNADDESCQKFVKAMGSRGEYITYGIKNGDLRASKVNLRADGLDYACGDIKVRLQIPGEFNVYNSLAAVGVGLRLGLSHEEISRGLLALESVEGRMTKIPVPGEKIQVIVDFAHTPDAFLKVFDSVKEHKGRIISLFGGAGRRDESTRFLRGKIAGERSDYIIVTEDDSRDEDPEAIAAEFVRGIEAGGKAEYEVVIDRREAISRAISLAEPGDLVLILGKGHEKTILRADGPHEFQDIVEAKKAIGK